MTGVGKAQFPRAPVAARVGRATEHRQSGRGDRLGKLFLLAWVPGTVCVVAVLMLNHLVSMPAPSDLERVRIGALAFTQTGQPYRFVHVIYQDCSCTSNLFTHLLDRGALPNATETILFVGEDRERRSSAVQAGFRYEEVNSAALNERLGIEAAPLLLILDEDGDRLAYIGGYYDVPATVHALDERLFAAVQRGERPDPLPLYGCATSERLKSAIDPLGLGNLR